MKKTWENSVDWESDNASSCCTLCGKKFGLLRQRRHHCRSCGRLVCGSCSSNKVKLDDTPDKRVVDEEMQRVCDPCYQIVTAKEEKVTQEIKQRERKMELLSVTSYLSDCLIDIFFLDGKYKTICFDETTTVGELAGNLYPSAKIAMFEVFQDMFDSKQYIYLAENEAISDIVARWRDERKKYVKLILPVYDSKVVRPLNSVFKKAKLSESDLQALKQGDAPVTPESSFYLRSTEDRIRSLQTEACTLQQELRKANAKIETWRTIYGKTNRIRGLETTGYSYDVTEEDDLAQLKSIVTDAPTTPIASGVGEALPQQAPPSGSNKRESFGWGLRQSFFKSPSNKLVNADTNNALANNAADQNDVGEIPRTRGSITDPPVQQQPATKSTRGSFFVRRSSYTMESAPSLSLDMDQVPQIDNVRHQRLVSVTSETPDTLSIIASVPFGCNPTETEFLQNYEAFLTHSEEDVSTFVRTFYNHVVSVEGFVTKYENFFEQIMKVMQDRGRQLYSDIDSPVSMWLVIVYQMVTSMDMLYECLMEFFEVLRPQLRNWLMTLLKVFTTFPITNPEALRSIFHLLWKEELLFEEEVKQVFTQAILTSFRKDIESTPELLVLQQSPHQSQSNESSLNRSFHNIHLNLQSFSAGGSNTNTIANLPFTTIEKYMTNIVNTFQYIIGDLLDLIPKEFQIMMMFQKLSWQLWEEVVKLWYRQQGSNLKFFQALSIYQFLETYGDMVSQFGVDQRKLSERIKIKKGEVYKLTCSSLVTDLQAVWKQCNATGTEMVSSAQQPLLYNVASSSSYKSFSGNPVAGNNDQQAAIAMSLASVASSQHSIALSQSSPKNDLSVPVGGDGGPQSVMMMRWSGELLEFVADVIRRLVHYVEPSQKSNIRMTVLILLFETLNELGPQQLEYLRNIRPTDSDFAMRYTAFVNSQIVFMTSLADTQEQAVDRISEELSEALDQKATTIIQRHEEHCEVALEGLAHIWRDQIYDICRSELFKTSWLTDTKVIQTLKKTMKEQLLGFQVGLVEDLQYSLRMRMRLTGYICEGLVHAYIECLLRNEAGLSLSIAAIARLNEDLQLLTALIEECRMMMLGTDDVHRVAPSASSGHALEQARRRRLLPFGSGKKTTAASPNNANNDNNNNNNSSNNNSLPTSPSPLLTSPTEALRKAINYTNKQVYDGMLQPLTHLILALQMDKQYLIPFVQEELFRDFGYHCIRVWILVEHWRGEKKEQIQQDYDAHLKHWRPSANSFEPKVDVGYIKDLRIVKAIKIQPLAPLMDG